MARILENFSLDLFKKEGLPVVDFGVASTPQEASAIATRMGRDVVVKAIIPVGKRGKAGAVKFAKNAQEAEAAARSLIGMEVRGYSVKKVLVAEKIEAIAEIYLSITVDQKTARPTVIVSLSGGVDIEEVAATNSDKIVTHYIDPLKGLAAHEVVSVLSKAGLNGKALTRVVSLLKKLYQVFTKYDATLIEINPLFLTADQRAIIPACVFTMDDGSLYRQPEFTEIAKEGSERTWRPLTKIERQVQEVQDRDPYRGTARYTEMDGDIGFMCGGGGGSLVLFDELVNAGGKPSNYTEFGGNPPEDKVYGLALNILSKPGIRGLLISHNITNNTQVDVEARGIVRAIKESGIDPQTFPIVARMPGIHEKEGFYILREAGIEFYGEDLTMAGSAKRMVEKVKQYMEVNRKQCQF